MTCFTLTTRENCMFKGLREIVVAVLVIHIQAVNAPPRFNGNLRNVLLRKGTHRSMGVFTSTGKFDTTRGITRSCRIRWAVYCSLRCTYVSRWFDLVLVAWTSVLPLTLMMICSSGTLLLCCAAMSTYAGSIFYKIASRKPNYVEVLKGP
jgi:hypothetical protein